MDTDAIDPPLDLGYSPIYSPLGPATPTSPSHEGRPLTFNDATSYLETVEDKFQDNIDVYDRFLDIMFTANSQT
jgi:histone deacetylase complex regulatory component SIN3